MTTTITFDCKDRVYPHRLPPVRRFHKDGRRNIQRHRRSREHRDTDNILAFPDESNADRNGVAAVGSIVPRLVLIRDVRVIWVGSCWYCSCLWLR